jgi:hypothetical protein
MLRNGQGPAAGQTFPLGGGTTEMGASRTVGRDAGRRVALHLVGATFIGGHNRGTVRPP